MEQRRPDPILRGLVITPIMPALSMPTPASGCRRDVIVTPATLANNTAGDRRMQRASSSRWRARCPPAICPGFVPAPIIRSASAFDQRADIDIFCPLATEGVEAAVADGDDLRGTQVIAARKIGPV